MGPWLPPDGPGFYPYLSEGFFRPIYTLLGWGAGLSFQHFGKVLRGQITEHDVRRKMTTFRAND